MSVERQSVSSRKRARECTEHASVHAVQLIHLSLLHTALSDGALLVGINVCIPGIESPSMIGSCVNWVRTIKSQISISGFEVLFE